MIALQQDRPARLDLVLRTPGGTPRTGVAPEDVTCQLKRAGDLRWTPRLLDAERWREAGHGAYVLALDATDLDVVGPLLVWVEPSRPLAPPLLPLLAEYEVVPAERLGATRPELERTTIVGHTVGLDGRPIAGATVSARLVSLPLVLGGMAVAGDAVITRSDEDGFFALSLVRGATVDIEIAALFYRRTLIVPTAPAPGSPVRLFAIA